ncbi:MAG TPA: TIGR03885 family FMN-dependent LLM class oxidoreductase, partial [Gammaproteobacteria bacterium]|nr:TIGR03885 family FMN-dependent LLM class oxidoreductase [Gammaproteobacteria bacterium]
VISFSYHASHEQFPPSELLRYVRQAEAAGFDAAFSSDHLQPWSQAQGHSGFAWAWLGAALHSTERMRFAAITVPGGWRYQPVVLAQAIATLGEMFPGRFPWVALGSGEALNERATAGRWPSKSSRHARLQRGAEIISELLDGKTVTRAGPPSAHEARIWSLPAERTALVGAAVTAATAAWLGSWADGLLTTAGTLEELRANVEAFRRNGGEGKPVYVKTQVCWAETDEQASRFAFEQWHCNAVPRERCAELAQPAHFEHAARDISTRDVERVVCVSSDLERHTAWLRDIAALGVDGIDIHQVGRNQAEFIAAFGRHVLPALRYAPAPRAQSHSRSMP